MEMGHKLFKLTLFKAKVIIFPMKTGFPSCTPGLVTHRTTLQIFKA